MKPVLLTALPVLALLGACSPAPAASPTSQVVPTTTQAPTTTTPAGPPPAPVPAGEGKCPYLDSSVVAQYNGQLVRRVEISDDRPTPACFFYADATNVQLSVWVFQGTPAIAKAVVDRAAPIATSSPATSPTGWNGGSLTTEEGAVYAVAKEGSAVVVTTNQKQTVKAKRLVEAVVGNLGL
ncbi:DUF2020 domain-containing protein [Actinosynnema sp. NPDC020468]|uniref:DUF2020 domain-containing protein n=1 Tax=Actinosynnema sp. NPDC020468 TaxID=3154488 RepID=UPI0033E74473